MALLSTQITGCSTIKSYIFKPVEYNNPEVIMQYNFIEPRRSELPQTTVTRLNPTNQNRFNYYSASGYSCRTLSLTTKQAACNIDGQWRGLAPILNTIQPL